MVVTQLLGMCKTLGLNPSTQLRTAPLAKVNKKEQKQIKQKRNPRTLKKKEKKKVVEGAKKRIIYNIKMPLDLRRKNSDGFNEYVRLIWTIQGRQIP